MLFTSIVALLSVAKSYAAPGGVTCAVTGTSNANVASANDLLPFLPPASGAQGSFTNTNGFFSVNFDGVQQLTGSTITIDMVDLAGKNLSANCLNLPVAYNPVNWCGPKVSIPSGCWADKKTMNGANGASTNVYNFNLKFRISANGFRASEIVQTVTSIQITQLLTSQVTLAAPSITTNFNVTSVDWDPTAKQYTIGVSWKPIADYANFTSTSITYVPYNSTGGVGAQVPVTSITPKNADGIYYATFVIDEANCGDLGGFGVQAIYNRNGDTNNPAYNYLSQWSTSAQTSLKTVSSNDCSAISFSFSGLFGAQLTITPSVVRAGGAQFPGDGLIASFSFDQTQFSSLTYTATGVSVNSYTRAAPSQFSNAPATNGTTTGNTVALTVANPCPAPADSTDPTCYYSFNAAGSSTLTLAYLVTLTQINGGNVRRDVSLLGARADAPAAGQVQKTLLFQTVGLGGSDDANPAVPASGAGIASVGSAFLAGSAAYLAMAL
jgi:hypothetical protein